jgi:hypothetical protein
MTIGRPQMYKEIKGYQAGGIAGLPYADSVANFENPLLAGNPSLTVPKLPPMKSLLPTRPLPTAPLKPYSALDDIADEREDVTPPRATAAQIKDLEEEVKDSEDSRRTFDDRFNEYKSKLAPLFGAAPRRRNFYDLASALGEGILASDPTAGPYGGLARGFAQFNKDSRKAADEARTIQRQIALKAFEMARQDETMAAEYLQKAQLELIKQGNKGTKFIAWEIPELDDAGNPTGKTIRRSAAETDLATQQEYQDLGGYPVTGGGTSVNVGGQATSGFLKKRGDLFAAAVSKWGEEAELARSQKNLLDTASSLSANLDADDRGRLASVTLPLREFMIDLGWADAKTVEAQQLVKSFGTRIAMGLIGQTKGAISNAEMTLFLASSPGLAMTKGGYDRLIGYLNRINQKSIDFQEAYSDAVASGSFDEALESGNDEKIASSISRWQARWHRENPLFSDQEKPEFQALAKEESREARLLREGFNSGSTSKSAKSNDVSGRF